MMGVGKSAVGRNLALLSERTFQDTDGLLERRLGRSIEQIFKIYGEPAFRDHETALLKTLEPGETILSTGGGIVLRPQNWDELRRLGLIIYLRADLDTLLTHLGNSKKRRPLLQTENWQERVESILSARIPLYEQADLIFDVGKDESIPDVGERLYARIKEQDAN